MIQYVFSFLKSPMGKMVVLLVICLLVVVLFFAVKGASGEKVVDNAVTLQKKSLQTVGEATTFTSPIPPATAARVGAAPQQQYQQPPPERTPIAIYVSKEAELSDHYAPYGRFIKCMLVNTVDSAKINTPIVGLVIEDVWHDGQLIIRAGTEIHGVAQADRARDRIAAQDKWVFVWRFPDDPMNGMELSFSGIVCAYLPDEEHGGWDVIDGSAGLPGDVIKSDKWAEIKRFAADMVQGLGEGLSSSQMFVSNGGMYQTTDGSFKSAVAKGFERMAEDYAQDIRQAIQRDGFFVRVASGTPFYVYTTQPIDLANAGVGASLTQPNKQK